MVRKNIIKKMSNKELNTGYARGRNICSKCKSNSLFLYNNLCPKCLGNNPEGLGDI